MGAYQLVPPKPLGSSPFANDPYGDFTWRDDGYCYPAYGWAVPTDVHVYTKVWRIGLLAGRVQYFDANSGVQIGTDYPADRSSLPTWRDDHTTTWRPIYLCGQRPGGYPDGTTGLPPGATTWSTSSAPTQPTQPTGPTMPTQTQPATSTTPMCPRFVTFDQATLDELAASGEPRTFTGYMIPSNIVDVPGFNNYYDVFSFTDRATGRTMYDTPYPPLAWQRLSSLPAIAVPEPPRCQSGDLQAQLDACNAAKDQLQRQLDACNDDRSSLQGQLTSAQQQMQDLLARIAALTTARDDLQNQLDKITAQYNDCIVREQDLQDKLRAAIAGSAGMQDLLNQLNQCQAEKNRLQEAYDQLVAQGAGAPDAQVQAELAQCHAELDALRISQDEKERVIAFLQDELLECKKQHASTMDPDLKQRLEYQILILTRQLTICHQKLSIAIRRTRGRWDPLAVYLGTGVAGAAALALWFGFGEHSRKGRAA